jgi:hypothetical protein
MGGGKVSGAGKKILSWMIAIAVALRRSFLRRFLLVSCGLFHRYSIASSLAVPLNRKDEEMATEQSAQKGPGFSDEPQRRRFFSGFPNSFLSTVEALSEKALSFSCLSCSLTFVSGVAHENLFGKQTA